MRRLLRIPLNAATMLSFILGAATATLWARSAAGAGDAWERTGPQSIVVAVLRGRLIVDIRARTFLSFRYGPREQVDNSVAAHGWRPTPATEYAWLTVASSPLGFYARRDESRDMTIRPGEDHIERSRLVAVPLWCPLAAFAILPATRLIVRHASGRRSSADLCPSCGYDLRATPDRCPECGAAAKVVA